MVPMHYTKPTLIKAKALPKNDRQSLGIVPMHYAKPSSIKAQALPKNAVNPKVRRNQKNSCTREQIALTNLKRSGFVFLIIIRIIEGWNTKRSAAVFLMCVG